MSEQRCGKQLRVDIREVKKVLAFRRRINRADLMTMAFYDGPRRLLVSKQKREDFKFTGLSNIDFIDLCLINKTTWIKTKP